MIARFNSPTITRTICVRRLLFILTSFWADYVASAAAAHQRIHKLAQREAKTKSGGWPIFALHHSHGGCPILAFFARVGGDAAGGTLVRSTPPVVYGVVVHA